MFTGFDKALVALAMAAIYFLKYFGIANLPFDEATLAAFLAAITPILVYFVPNFKK